MKSTFLVFVDPSDPKAGLRVASLQEWDQILKKNKTLPREERRFFIADAFEDCGVIDCMYIETTRDEYNKWHSQKVYSDRKRGYEEQYGKISLQAIIPETDELPYVGVVADALNLEESVLSEDRFRALKSALAQWKPWAVEMMELYLAEKKEEASFIISKEYDVSIRTVQRWKLMFEKFVIKFFENF